jgi:hypothetical protein
VSSFAPNPLDLVSFDLVLLDSVQHGGGGPRNLNAECRPTWRRSTRSIGGYWLGTANLDSSPADQMDLFLNGIGREIRESVGNAVTWQGFLAEAALTIGGQTYLRRWLDLANRTQVIYTKLGDNLLSNGSVESAAWGPDFNGPDVSSGQSTTWVNDGTYSMFISNTVSPNGGKYITQSITIVAGKSYDFQMAVNLVSGTWTLVIRQNGAGVDGAGHPLGILAQSSESNVGQRIMKATVPNTNTYAGVIDVLIYNPDAINGQIYCDAATFRETPVQARTAWYSDSLSVLEFGTLEMALLQGSMADATANAHAATALAESKWLRTLPPSGFGGASLGQPDGLVLTFAGYSWSLRNKYAGSSRVGNTQNASTHVTNLIGDAEYVTAGKISGNTFQYQIDDRAPLRVWEVLRDITLAGDASGNRWTCGVYNDRLFEYVQASTTPDYHYRAGQLLTQSNDPVLPWLARPGLVYLDDMPVGPGSLTTNAADDPHVLFMEEVEFEAAAYLAGQGGLNFSHLTGSNEPGGA